MKIMLKAVGCILYTFWGLQVPAEDIRVNRWERQGVFAAAGETNAVDGTVTVAREGRLVKTGEGTVNLPVGNLTSAKETQVDVLAGTLDLSGSAMSREVVVPTCVTEKAVMWLDATKNTVSGEADGSVVAWRDVRDTDPAATNFPYAALAAAYWKAPTRRQYDGRDTVYFGGFGSKCTLDWFTPAGATNEIRIGAVFIVTAISNSYGHIIGRCTPYTAHAYQPGSPAVVDGTVDSPVLGGAPLTEMTKMRYYRDGEPVDVWKTRAKRGLQLLEYVSSPGFLGYGECFFNHYCGGIPFSYNNLRAGGDDLSEVIVFNAIPSETERLQIEKYLWMKWFGGVNDVAVNTADGAKVRLGGETSPFALRVRGNGTLEVAGESLARVREDAPSSFAGRLSLQDGATVVTESELPVALRDGATLTVEEGIGNEQSYSLTADAGAGRIRKSGDGRAKICEAPETVETIQVAEGELMISAPPHPAAAPAATVADIRVPIPNPGFEDPEFFNKSETGASFFQGASLGGWSAKDGSWMLGYLNHKTTSRAWMVPVDAPEGDWAFVLKNDAAGTPGSATATVRIPADGRYELSFWTTRRAGNPVPNYCVNFERNGVVRTAGYVVAVGQETLRGGYAYVRQRSATPVLEAGDWTMTFAPCLATGDNVFAFDDVRLTLITEPAEEKTVEVPNGGFECVSEVTDESFFDPKAYSSGKNVPADWTLTQAGLGVTEIPSVGPVFANMGGRMCNPVLLRYGSKCLGFWSSGGTATSKRFCPGAGRYKLRLRAVFAGCADGSGLRYWHDVLLGVGQTIAGSVALGESSVVELGSVVDTSCNMWDELTFGQTFEVASDETEIAITLAGMAESGASLIDDVELVKIEDPQPGAQPALASVRNLEIASGASVRLDFAGTLHLESVTIGGRRVGGRIDAARFPGCISGEGALETPPLGLSILVR